MKNSPPKTAKFPHEIAACVGHYLKTGDLEGIVTLFHPDCVLYFPPDEPAKQGLDSVRQVFTPFLEVRPTLISNVVNEVINGDTAILQAHWRLEDSEGHLLSEGQSTEVAKRNAEGCWQYYIDCPLGLPEKS